MVAFNAIALMVSKPHSIAAKYFLDLDAARALRDAANDLPQRVTSTRQH